jgi:hypothetical protein
MSLTRDRIMAVPCAYCGAGKGQACRAEGYAQRITAPHAGRRRAARAWASRESMLDLYASESFRLTALPAAGPLEDPEPEP